MSELDLLRKLNFFLSRMDDHQESRNDEYHLGRQNSTDYWAEQLRELIDKHNKSRLGL